MHLLLQQSLVATAREDASRAGAAAGPRIELREALHRARFLDPRGTRPARGRRLAHA